MKIRKHFFLCLFAAGLLAASDANAQCSICTKTAQQMGEKPAKALNGGIIYLAATPLAILGILGFRWYRANKDML
ncbi:MAG TPA: hypothetical protein PLQ32_03460 [Flavihumibacter sp.]|nr:hypothetical protein [Bacteroidota bacterium]HOA36752.1 hypothetical protein [Flavihumibacter sp.]HPZ87136.1 hypothetical protein [Flavihumibacter sp.]HQD08314.1 hypothetical protein [Flavihumibacter sp.]